MFHIVHVSKNDSALFITVVKINFISIFTDGKTEKYFLHIKNFIIDMSHIFINF